MDLEPESDQAPVMPVTLGDFRLVLDALDPKGVDIFTYFQF